MKGFFLPWLAAVLLFCHLTSLFTCSAKPCLAKSGPAQTRSVQTESLPEHSPLATGRSFTGANVNLLPETDQSQTPGHTQSKTQSQLPDQANSQTERQTGKKQAVSSLFAKFIQEKTSSILARPLLSTGFVCLRNKSRPSVKNDGQTGGQKDRQLNGSGTQDAELLWSYTRPAVHGLLYRNGKAMMLQADASLRQPNQREMAFTANIVKMLMLWLAPTQEVIASQFEVAENDPDRRRLVLLPRQTGIFRKMTVTFAENRQTLDELLFEEKNGNTLRLTFTDTSLNQSLPGQCQQLTGMVAD